MIKLDLKYNGLEASLMPFVEAVEYIDFMAGKPSELKVTLCNADGRFSSPAWSATCGDSLSLQWGSARPEPLAISGVGVERVPRLVVWSARSLPVTSSAPSGRGGGAPPPSSGALVDARKSWDTVHRVRLSDVARRVCAECGIALKYLSKNDPVIAQVARYNETGYHLLERLCRRYGLAVRSTSSAVQIISRPATHSADAPVQAAIDLPENRIISLQNVDSLPARSVNSVRRDPRSGAVVRRSVGSGDGAAIGLFYDIEDSEIYDEAALDAQSSQLSVYPDDRLTAGSLLKTPYGLRVITEMHYNRTGDAETMELLTRAAK